MRRFIAFAFAVISSIAFAADAIGRAFTELIDRGLSFLSDDARADLARLMGMPALALDAPGVPLDSALTNSLRHEAGTPRRAAPRNC